MRPAQQVVIIGAPRSGTNMLRDVLTALPGVATWPCDEINYVWRHGNARYPSDELPRANASPAAVRYIRRQFDWVARRYHAHTVVEKTCANSLRVPFVDVVVPNARYVFIRRDGLDVVGSALERWRAPLDVPYVLRKARFVPITELPYYAARYLGNRVHRRFSQKQNLAFWGPRLDDMETLLATHSLDEVCAIQWKRCVDAAVSGLQPMPCNRWVEVGYEDFVTEPERQLARVVGFLGLQASDAERRHALGHVRASRVGKGRAALDSETAQRLLPLIHDTLVRYAYA